MSTIRANFGFKGERGLSAYEIAVKNGFKGSESDWLATLGTASSFKMTKIQVVANAGTKQLTLPEAYTSNGFLDVYVEGERLRDAEYTIDETNDLILLTNAISVSPTNIEIVILTMATNSMPIVGEVNETTTNDVAVGGKAVYDALNDVNDALNTKLNVSNIKVLTGNAGAVVKGEGLVYDIAYPEGFTKANTLIMSNMSSNNNVYYDSIDETDTTNGYVMIKTIALTDNVIRVWFKNNSTEDDKLAYYKIGLMRID